MRAVFWIYTTIAAFVMWGSTNPDNWYAALGVFVFGQPWFFVGMWLFPHQDLDWWVIGLIFLPNVSLLGFLAYHKHKRGDQAPVEP